MNAEGCSAVESVSLGSPCGMGAPIATPAGFIKFAPVEIDEQDRQEDANPRPVASPAEGDGLGDKDDVASKQTTLDDAVGANAIDQSEGNEVVDDPADNNSDDTGEPDDGALKPAPAIDSTDEAKSSTDDSGDEAEQPQPVRVVELPEDFDWRKLKPRRYGKSLPPLDSVERQSLEETMVGHGFLGKILIDNLLQIIEGNTRWEICCERGIVPTVEMVAGLSDEEKEELAFSQNLDRRHLENEDKAQVFEARLDNLLNLQRKNPKKWTLEKIAKAVGVSIATVAARRDIRHDSEGGTASKPDARRKYDDHQKREAVRLIKEGTAKSVVARQLCMSVKAVERAEKEAKEREAGGSAAKDGKHKKAAAAKPAQLIEDITASDGVPRVHQPAVQDLGLDAQGYMKLVKTERARALEDSKAVADEKHENLKQAVYHAHMAGIFNSRLQPSLAHAGEAGADEAGADEALPGDSGPDGAGYEVGTVLRGIVIADEPDGVFVALPLGGGGVIDKRNGCLAMYGPHEVDEVVRVRVEGFDRKRRLWKLQPQARQTVAPAPGAIAGSHRDDRFSPDTKLAGRKTGPKEQKVTK